MKYHFCTLFDKNFLVRGLALHQSLLDHCTDFTLWMLCVDDESYATLEKMNLEKVNLLRLSEVEDDQLRAVKPTRTPVEYCWMFSSSLPLYLFKKNPTMNTLAYLDADLFFYASPDEIYKEFGNRSIMIIPQRFAAKQNGAKKAGDKFNVGMVIFRNDPVGLKCLVQWKQQCIDWCYNRFENGKHGDQGYLNAWPEEFGEGLCVLEHEGGNLGPWDIMKYNVSEKNGSFWITDRKNINRTYKIIFYHFHGVLMYVVGKKYIKAHPIKILQPRLYSIYLDALNDAYKKVLAVRPDWDYGFNQKLDVARYIKQSILRPLLNILHKK